jgi:flagellar biosynthesis protein FlhG
MTPLSAIRELAGARPGTAVRGLEHALVVAAGKGGVGVSTVSALLAHGAAAAGRRALLVDAAPAGGSLRTMLGLEDEAQSGQQDFQVRDIAPRIGFAAIRPARWNGPGERQALLRRLTARYGSYDFVIIDAGATWESILSVLTAGAGRLLAVSASDRLSVVATYALIKLAHERFPELPLSVLLNRTDPAAGAVAFSRIAAGVETFLHRPVNPAGSLPDDATLRAATEAGLPPTAQEGPAAHAARLLAELLSVREARQPRTRLRLT